MLDPGMGKNPSAPPPVLRRRKRLLLASLLIPLLGLAGLFLWFLHSSNQALHEANAEADRLDPGWRMAELLEKQAPRSQTRKMPPLSSFAPTTFVLRTGLAGSIRKRHRARALRFTALRKASARLSRPCRSIQ